MAHEQYITYVVKFQFAIMSEHRWNNDTCRTFGNRYFSMQADPELSVRPPQMALRQA